ncbi:hypothetical protein [Methylocapsa acidiphila]|nr:hypothetical protein [Methylocapsa acidiphila]
MRRLKKRGKALGRDHAIKDAQIEARRAAELTFDRQNASLNFIFGE